jgi:X-Pro dipeptidyl-peptidase C-terminal non-catalytic domain
MRPGKSDPPSVLYWQSAPLVADLDIVGPIELQLTSTSTAIDTALIVMLSDAAPDGPPPGSPAGGCGKAYARSIRLRVALAHRSSHVAILKLCRSVKDQVTDPIDLECATVPGGTPHRTCPLRSQAVSDPDQPVAGRHVRNSLIEGSSDGWRG